MRKPCPRHPDVPRYPFGWLPCMYRPAAEETARCGQEGAGAEEALAAREGSQSRTAVLPARDGLSSRSSLSSLREELPMR